MSVPLQVTFRGMEPSPALTERIHAEADKLEALYGRITRCHVVVDQPHRRHRQGRHFRVLIELRIPRVDIVVGRDPDEHREYEQPYLAVAEAFAAAGRRLQESARARREAVRRQVVAAR